MPWHPTLINSQILAVHAALVPAGAKGKVLMFGGDEHWSAQAGDDENPADPDKIDRTSIYEVGSLADATKIGSPTTDVFCAGHAQISDGRLLVGGGTETWGGEVPGGPGGGHVHWHGDYGGHQACWIYNYDRNEWVRVADMNFEVGAGKGGGRWYPTIITLPTGDLAAFGGHPSRRSEEWHENEIPERYSSAGNFWTWYPNRISFEHPSLPGNWYPRASLITGGWLFFTSKHNNECRFFDSNTGNLVGPVVNPPGGPYNSGWDYSVIQLPIVPGDNYRNRVMAVDGVQPRFIELNLDSGAPTPNWADAGARQGIVAAKSRRFCCPVYLPTGQLFISGGIDDTQSTNDTDAVKHPEIFTPNIDWATRTYNSGSIGTWQTLETEPAQVARNYHSVTLLSPDGSVFISGSNINGDSGDPAAVGQRNIEIYFPAYFSNPARPRIASAPDLLSYVEPTFNFTMENAAQAAAVNKVALIRCGSATHSCDFDHRYVALAFDHSGGPNITVTLPQDASVLPPGFYMLWAVDNADLPCELAPFVRIGHVGCDVITDRSTFSEEEVQSFSGTASFPFAVYAVFDGFRPGELVGSPSIDLTWDDDGSSISNSDMRLVASSSRWLEHPSSWTDVGQRITYPYTVEILNTSMYTGITDRRRVRVTFTMGAHTCSQTLDLTKTPNPYMIDIDPTEQNPHWLSTDIRTLRVREGQTLYSEITHGGGSGAPAAFARAMIDRFRSIPDSDTHPFRNLPAEGNEAAVDLAPLDGSSRVYNYAFAKVRYRAVTTQAERVKVFFRLCTTLESGLAYNSSTIYNHNGPGLSTVPLLGRVGGEIVTIPFFLSRRQETVVGRPGAGPMTDQTLEDDYEVQTIVPNASGEAVAYFGCWLDINEPGVKRFPLMGSGDGPWGNEVCQPIQEFFRSPHHCLVAEVYFEPDATDPGETPGTCDNLSQRNLALLNAPNPAAPSLRDVLHPFEIEPSKLPSLPQLFSGDGDSVVADWLLPDSVTHGHFKRRYPDELLIAWHNLPRDSQVTIYFSDIDTAEIGRLITVFRRVPAPFTIVDNRTILFRVAGHAWLPIPGGRQLNLPALLRVELPGSIVSGQHFRITVHQVSGITRRIVGSFQIDIPVSKAELILPGEVRTLSIMKHIATTIPSTNRWYPIFQRYLHGLSGRVDGLGGDSDSVHPNPDGSGTPYVPPVERPDAQPCVQGWLVGLIAALTILVAGLPQSRIVGVVALAVGVVLTAVVVAWWKRRCCGPMRCALLDYLSLGGTVGLAGLVGIAVISWPAQWMLARIAIAAVAVAGAAVAGFLCGCRNRCCNDDKACC